VAYSLKPQGHRPRPDGPSLEAFCGTSPSASPRPSLDLESLHSTKRPTRISRPFTERDRTYSADDFEGCDAAGWSPSGLAIVLLRRAGVTTGESDDRIREYTPDRGGLPPAWATRVGGDGLHSINHVVHHGFQATGAEGRRISPTSTTPKHYRRRLARRIPAGWRGDISTCARRS
jgi:hypothetical protein